MNNQCLDEAKQIASHTLLKKNCDLEYLLMGDLRLLLQATTDSRTRSSLPVLLNRLILNLQNLLEISSLDSFMVTVLDRRPNWSRQNPELYQTNLECVSTLVLIRDCLENDQNFDANSITLDQKLKKWIESFSVIRCLESTMLQEAFTVEFGGEA